MGRFGRDLLTQRDLTQPLDIVDPKTGIDYYTAASALSNLARKFALANNGGQPTNYYQGVITPAQIGSVTAAMLGPTAQYWVDMLPTLRPGATQYADLLTGFVPTATNTTDGLMQAVFDLYYNPALSVIGDEIVGLADVDSVRRAGRQPCGSPATVLLQWSARLVGQQLRPVPEQPGHLHVWMEFHWQFQLPRAAGQPEKTVQPRSSV